MALVVKLANRLMRKAAKSEEIKQQLQSEDWLKFVDGELKRSNHNDGIALGGLDRS